MPKGRHVAILVIVKNSIKAKVGSSRVISLTKRGVLFSDQLGRKHVCYFRWSTRVHLFIQQTFPEQQLYIRHCGRGWTYYYLHVNK